MTAVALVRVMLSGDRQAHSLAVGRRADQLAIDHDLPEPDRLLVVDAAYLHDIGYSRHCAATGWHPLDGARWLTANGWPAPICRLVLWHTASWHEGQLRGLYAAAVDEYGPPSSTGSVLDAIIAAADLTTDPGGQPTTIDARLAEVRHRYPADSLVVRALDLAEPNMRDLHRRAQAR